MQFTKALPEDAGKIAEIIRDGMIMSWGKFLVTLTIYNTPGMANYIEDHIRSENKGSDARFIVCRDQDKIVGCFDVKVFSKELFYNWMAILPEYQNRKIGGRLYYEAIKMFANEFHTEILTDVFTLNVNSKRFIERAGFKEVSKSNWYLLDIPACKHDLSFYSVEFPQAEIVHHRYGFSHFDISTPQGTYSVGRIGDNVYRLKNFNWYYDQAFLTGLKTIGPNRKLLVISDADSLPEKLPEPIAVLLRLKSKTDELRSNLERLGYDKIS